MALPSNWAYHAAGGRGPQWEGRQGRTINLANTTRHFEDLQLDGSDSMADLETVLKSVQWHL